MLGIYNNWIQSMSDCYMKKTLPLVAIAVGIAISSTANAQESAQVEQAQQPGAVSIRLSALT